MSTLHNSVKWIKKEYGGAFFHIKAVVLAFAATIYTIWSPRNKTLFAGLAVASKNIVKAIKLHVLTMLQNLYPLEHFALYYDLHR